MLSKLRRSKSSASSSPLYPHHVSKPIGGMPALKQKRLSQRNEALMSKLQLSQAPPSSSQPQLSEFERTGISSSRKQMKFIGESTVPASAQTDDRNKVVSLNERTLTPRERESISFLDQILREHGTSCDDEDVFVTSSSVRDPHAYESDDTSSSLSSSSSSTGSIVSFIDLVGASPSTSRAPTADNDNDASYWSEDTMECAIEPAYITYAPSFAAQESAPQPTSGDSSETRRVFDRPEPHHQQPVYSVVDRSRKTPKEVAAVSDNSSDAVTAESSRRFWLRLQDNEQRQRDIENQRGDVTYPIANSSHRPAPPVAIRNRKVNSANSIDERPTTCQSNGKTRPGQDKGSAGSANAKRMNTEGRIGVKLPPSNGVIARVESTCKRKPFVIVPGSRHELSLD